MAYKYSIISCIGGRDLNEDSVSFARHKGAVVAIVADGLGGHGSGDIASSLAVKEINNYFKQKKTISLKDIPEALSTSNKTVNLLNGPKTTIAMLVINDNIAVSAHVGDSRIYQFRNGKIIFQSIDHSVSQLAVAAGEINAEEIRHHIDRNKLLRALGDSEKINVDIKELSMMKKDAFLLCSDGFWELILEEEMEHDLITYKDPKKWLKNMSGRVKNKITDKSDNYSAVVLIV